ncbi:ferrochelatase [Arcanobacterium hippocoleae]
MAKRGCLLVALGTPASPEPNDIREFLRAFLSDPAVVDFPRWLWKPILHHIVLRVRPEKVAPTYSAIWTADGSPLEVHTKAQWKALAAELPEIEVRYAMTYTKPSIAEAISQFTAEEVVVIPLFPHYAPSTVADIRRQVSEIAKLPGAPQLSIAAQWPENSEYISWYQGQIRTALQDCRPDKIVFSYHGVPQRKVHNPDSYRQQCLHTTAGIMRAFTGVAFETTFQSKFGPGKWLQPATIERIAQLPHEGIKSVLLATPGFTADCIETIDELDVLNQSAFKEAGGENYARLAPVNGDAAVGKILASIYRQHFSESLPE